MSTGERIRNTREDLDILQQELADAVGINVSVLSRIEKGTRAVRADELVKIANKLHVSTDYLLENDTNHLKTSPSHMSKGDPVSEIFDDPDLRGLARRNFEKLTPEQIQKKKQRSLRLMRAMFDEEDD